MVEKLKTLFWFLRRPHLYPQLFYLLKSRILDHHEDEKRDLAQAWCSERSVTVREALDKITGESTVATLCHTFKPVFEEAEKKAKASPVEMGGPGDLDLLYNLCEFTKANRVVETGVAYGWSSLAILLSLQHRKDPVLISTDMPYAKMGNEDYVGCVVPDDLRNNWQLIRLPDRQGLPKALSQLSEIDVCHYDSDKSYRGRKWAYPLLWNALREHGIFISDDIGDNFAFKDFAEKVGKEPIIVRSEADHHVEKYVGILVKN